MNRKKAQGLLAVALVCAAALPAAADEQERELTGWQCAIDLEFSPIQTGNEIFTGKSKLDCEREGRKFKTEVTCRTTLDRPTLTRLGIKKKQKKTFKRVPCRIEASRCDRSLKDVLTRNSKLQIDGTTGKAVLTCEKEIRR